MINKLCFKINLLTLFVVTFGTTVATAVLPGYDKDDILDMPPLTVRLNCRHSTEDEVMRQNHFHIESLKSGEWSKVGEVLIQAHSPLSADTEKFGTHVRIRSITADVEAEYGMYAPSALKILLANYAKDFSSFQNFKTEESDYNKEGIRVFTGHGFTVHSRISGFGSDVQNYTRPRILASAASADAAGVSGVSTSDSAGAAGE